jgi:hypothetical protein
MFIVHRILLGMRWDENVARAVRSGYKILVGKPERNRPVGTRRRRWDGDIKRILGKQNSGALTGFIWLSTGVGVGFLRTQ